MVGLKIGDFQEMDDGQVLLRILGKGGKTRAVPISPELWVPGTAARAEKRAELRFTLRRSQAFVPIQRRPG